MNPLHRNDRPGAYPPSFYASAVTPPDQRGRLEGDLRVDVGLLGAGFTGLWAAKSLAEKGLTVAVVEAHRAGWGASGRNGGQVGSGYNRSQQWLEGRLGEDSARALWEMAEAGKAQIKGFCAAEAPEAHWKPGVAHGAYSAQEAQEERRNADFLARRYGYTLEPMGRAAFADLVKSPLYQGGALDRGAAHLDPLAYALALARAAEAAGATLFEGSEVLAIEPGTPAMLRTGQGRLIADHLIIAGNGYLPAIEGRIAAKVMPINSFIAATEPMDDWQSVLAEDIAVADSKFVVNYYRFSEDRRFLFGGRESYSITFPGDISGPLLKRMTRLFPQLAGAKTSHVWGGTLGITASRLPHLGRVTPNILTGAGFSGHGVGLSGLAGKVMAEAVAGQAGRFDVMAALRVPSFPGGGAFRAPLLTLAMTWYGLRDRFGI